MGRPGIPERGAGSCSDRRKEQTLAGRGGLFAALWLGRERARLAACGLPAPRADGEIAAVAMANGLTLITRNQADFANFEGLVVENWFA